MAPSDESNDDDDGNDDWHTFWSWMLAPILALLVIGAALLCAKEQCLIDVPSVPQFGGTHGSPTLIEPNE
jgi:hypothetical protein